MDEQVWISLHPSQWIKKLLLSKYAKANSLLTCNKILSMRKFLPLLLLGLIACSESIEIDPDTGFEVFTIRSGSHSSIIRNETFEGNGIAFKVIFDESAIYTTQDPGNQADINKLLGFSNCLKHHQSESARVGWRWYQNELQILSYVYTEADVKFELLGTIPFNQEVNIRVDIEPTGYRFTGDGLTETFVTRNAEGCTAGENYWLWPYFGGDETPNQDITIKIERETL